MNFKKVKMNLSELSDFLRLNISIFLTTTAVIGFLLFNEISIKLLFIILASFFLASYTYSFNNLTDKKEDFINKGRINKFAVNKSGFFIVMVLVLLGLLFSFFLNPLTTTLYMLLFSLVTIYSFFRIKRFFLVKNIYTSLFAILFLIGSTAGGTLNFMMFVYSALFALIFFIGSIVSDLRDFKGDREVKLKTLPIILGYKRTQFIIIALICLFLLVVIIFKLTTLYLIALFMIPAAWLIFSDKMGKIHNICGYSFILTVLWLTILSFG